MCCLHRHCLGLPSSLPSVPSQTPILSAGTSVPESGVADGLPRVAPRIQKLNTCSNIGLKVAEHNRPQHSGLGVPNPTEGLRARAELCLLLMHDTTP